MYGFFPLALSTKTTASFSEASVAYTGSASQTTSMKFEGLIDRCSSDNVFLNLVIGRRKFGQQFKDSRNLVLRDDDYSVDWVAKC
jgi:hypothetical protein